MLRFGTSIHVTSLAVSLVSQNLSFWSTAFNMPIFVYSFKYFQLSWDNFSEAIFYNQLLYVIST